MTYMPDIKNGMKLITCCNERIIHDLSCQADMTMARLEVERTESYAAIKTRHANELKSAKRNFKHRTKKIKTLMADFEKMEPMVLADLFKGGVPDDAVSAKLDTKWVPQRMGWSSIETRVIANEMSGRQMGKSDAIAKMYGMYIR
jgi:hypothetical protein